MTAGSTSRFVHGLAPEAIAEIARRTRIDPRIPRIVPGFDAPFFQAGLAGYSDGAMRLIARQFDCPFCVTEALLDRTLICGGKGRAREDPDLLSEECGTGDLAENRAAGLEDHPIAGQIMGTRPDEMAAGTRILVEMGYDVIDVNFACPVKKVRRRNRGGHFLGAPEEAVAVLRAVRDAMPPEMPMSVKLRRAWDDTPEAAAAFDEVFDAAYAIGAAWTTVHCRTVRQRYDGPARWPFLAELVRRHPDRLVFGSGDVWTAGDIFAMLETTGVQAVSVARGCIGNPWIFREARRLMAGSMLPPPSLPEQADVLRRHFMLARSLHGEKTASRTMRKFGIKFSQHHPDAEAVRAEFVRCRSTAEWEAVLEARYSAAPDGPMNEA